MQIEKIIPPFPLGHHSAGINPSSSKLGNLPADVIKEIFSNLPLVDLVTCTIVNKLWRKISNDSSLWQQFCLSDFFCHSSPTRKDLQEIQTNSKDYFYLCSTGTYVCDLEFGNKEHEVTFMVVKEGLLIAGYMDSFIRFWNLTTGNCEFSFNSEFNWHHAMIHDIKLQGSKLFSCSTDGYINVWDIEKRKLIKDFKVPRDNYVNNYAFKLEVDDERLIAVCVDGSIYGWNFATRELINKFQSDEMIVAFLRHGQDKLIIARYGGKIEILNLLNDQVDVLTFESYSDWMTITANNILICGSFRVSNSHP